MPTDRDISTPFQSLHGSKWGDDLSGLRIRNKRRDPPQRFALPRLVLELGPGGKAGRKPWLLGDIAPFSSLFGGGGPQAPRDDMGLFQSGKYTPKIPFGVEYKPI